MNQEEAFLAAIKADRDDLSARQMFADWLMENGQPERGEFITCHLQAASLPASDPVRDQLLGKAKALLDANRDTWETTLRELGVEARMVWDQGFPAKIRISAADFVANAEAIFAIAPTITHAAITDLALDQIDDFAGCPSLANLTHLFAGFNRIGDAGVHAIAGSAHLEQLKALDLRETQMTAAGANSLAISPTLKNLTHLHLGNNGIGDEGVRAIADSPTLTNLTSLTVWGNNIGDPGIQTLATSPNVKHITDLILVNNRIGDEGAQAIAASLHLHNLTFLDLGRNDVGDIGAQALAGTPNLPVLTFIELGDNQIGNAGGRALASSPLLQRLTRLNLGRNDIGENLLEQIDRTISNRRNQKVDLPPL